MNIKKILFPTDFSRCAEQALVHAVFLSEKYNSEIHVLHVVTLYEDQPKVISSEISETKEMIKKLEDTAEKQLNKVTGTYDIKIITSTKRGISAAPAILEYSLDNDIDLIVMGTSGRRGIGHLLLGSVAEEVVRLSACPVLTVRGTEKPKSIESVNNILVPVDFSEHSKNALAYAAKFAECYDAKLQVLHIIEDTMHPAFSLVGKTSIFDLIPGIEEDCWRRAEKMLEDSVPAEIKSEVFIKGGRAANEIINFAKDNSTDLIIIATHGLTGLEHMLLGSVTEKVVRMAHCPVLTVKAFGKSII
jgi:nucleotide-binding universal stress UspA family protein